jgi:glycerate kinase
MHAIDAGATDITHRPRGLRDQRRGAGLLGALRCPADRPLGEGAAGLAGVEVDLDPAARARRRIELTCASDVDALTGLFGATKTFGPQRIPGSGSRSWTGCSRSSLRRPTVVPPREGRRRGRRPRLRPAAPRRAARPGFDVVADALDLPARARRADLVVTGEGAFDFASRSGKVPYGVATVAAEALRPCVALAGRVLVGAREMRALGIESAYSLVELVGEDRALGDPTRSLAELAARVARTWSR